MKVNLKRNLFTPQGRFRKGLHLNFPDALADNLPKDAEVFNVGDKLPIPERPVSRDPSLKDQDAERAALEAEREAREKAEKFQRELAGDDTAEPEAAPARRRNPKGDK